jgi:hypothetical protein
MTGRSPHSSSFSFPQYGMIADISTAVPTISHVVPEIGPLKPYGKGVRQVLDTEFSISGMVAVAYLTGVL